MTDPLIRDLRALGASLPAPEPAAELTAAVLARVATEPVPVKAGRFRRIVWWARARWRALVSLLTGLVLVGALTPPVRAAVAEWFGFGAVEIRTSTGAGPSTAPAPPTALGAVTLDQARTMVAFDVVVPEALGPPAATWVSADRVAVSMSWTGGPDGPVRLDQVGQRLAPYFVKTVYDEVEFTSVGGAEALWLPRPHHIVVQAPDGSQRTEPARLAGRTLIWQSGNVTLRLEGDLDRERAVAIAESAR
ncbi:hypothetical protein [Alloactinosynnema sp. L-07]|uniref:hypothetical protein n=1 Tax=Alloactinosynnema sp. L-07 TaxID=1653480 RepID=UPI00065EFA8C|nr:hypothetical protein [Alloactinosynnema sp. L-07]CRK56561.1 hypothetical protein [Alloactinosynnema sp. L-07]